MIWIALGAGSAFLLCGVGIAYAIGAGSVLAFILTDQHQFLAALPQRIFSQFDRFVLLSLPLFILTGEIMNRSGVTRALVDLSDAILGRTRGGLGNANILASVFFAGISGSAIADAATLSKTLVPEMEKRGYKHSYAAAITAASSVIGPIVPPSIILILYGAVTQTSVAALFAAGIVPGLLLAFSLGCLNAFIARRENHPTGHPVRVWPVFVQALPALTLPVIIVGGIVFGLMTPTEAASVAVVAAIGAGSIYGGVTYQVFWEAVQGTIRLTGSLFMLLAAVAVLGYFAGLMQWPQWIADGIAGAGPASPCWTRR